MKKVFSFQFEILINIGYLVVRLTNDGVSLNFFSSFGSNGSENPTQNNPPNATECKNGAFFARELLKYITWKRTDSSNNHLNKDWLVGEVPSISWDLRSSSNFLPVSESANMQVTSRADVTCLNAGASRRDIDQGLSWKWDPNWKNQLR